MFRRTPAFARLCEHEVVIHTGAETDPLRLAAQLIDCDAVVLTQQRVRLARATIERLPRLRFVSQTGRNAYHIDLEACTAQGIIVSVGGIAGPSGAGSFASTTELTWALILSALHHLPYEIERLKQGHWQSTVGTSLHGLTLGIYAYGHIGRTASTWHSKNWCRIASSSVIPMIVSASCDATSMPSGSIALSCGSSGRAWNRPKCYARSSFWPNT
jgi:D-3-phosphoglycerate dehydrogenase